MSLDYAILGFLNYKPMTGYDLKKFFDDSVRHFWHADQSQIYRSLAKLKKEDLAEMEVVRQEDRPDRKVYRITAKGQAALRDWLSGPPPMGAPHSAPLIQVFFSGMFNDAQVKELFQRNIEMMSSMGDSYSPVPEAIEKYKHMLGSEREAFFWWLTYDLGMRVAKAQLEWAQTVIKLIDDGQVPQD